MLSDSKIPTKPENFKEYRQKNSYAEKTVKVQNSHLKGFTEWCIKQNITPEKITYDEILNFIDSERSRSISKASVIRTINSLKIYYDFLVKIKAIRHNIVRQIRLRNEGKRVLPELLSAEQLDKIYRDYSNLPQWQQKSEKAKLLHQRNIVVLGLLIGQGLNSGEITKLEMSYINLGEGKIYVPSTRKSNVRTLKLQANQILPLKTYTEEIRPKLLEKRNLQVVERSRNYLFPVKKSSDMICKIIEEVKKLYHGIKDSRQIRASVIMNWLKQYNIRQVQYMAGHKSIKSTEAYRYQDLTDLGKQLELFHPLAEVASTKTGH